MCVVCEVVVSLEKRGRVASIFPFVVDSVLQLEIDGFNGIKLNTSIIWR